ncbi:hypothetical protein [Anatilimnocola floriformis]|uniref:hypothetical protein n=1 Tax=Anatilimnocola floriformis TaxID=2948575 RepID=UPI0020C53E8A|nr:hypothetical protein [Anatilimnocola floriformis]
MIELNPAAIPTANATQIERFKQFLDRNFGGWRSSLIHEADRLCTWKSSSVNQRHAKLWGDFVEVWDDTSDTDGPDDLLQHRICSVVGDLTPVAVWQSG